MRVIADTEGDPDEVGDVPGIIEKLGKVTSIMRLNDFPRVVNFVPTAATGILARGKQEKPGGCPSSLTR